jgi:hypothetical protein
MTTDEPITEPDNSTVTDWLGQEVAKDDEIADEAVREAGGDMDKAEEIFESRSHVNDPEAVPSVAPSERPS